MIPSIKEQSYGIIPLRRKGSEWEVLLIQHRTAGHWGFPKGHAEEGESPQQTACRELLEETNLEVTRLLSPSIFEEHYQYMLRGNLMDKTVWYFVAEVQGIIQLQEIEVKASEWIPLANACELLTYDTDKSACRQAIAVLR